MVIDLENPEALKRQLRPQLAQIIPADHVDEVLDLTIHSVRSAFEAMQRVLQSADDPRTQIAVAAPAFSLLIGLAQGKLEEIMDFARKAGMKEGVGKIGSAGQ